MNDVFQYIAYKFEPRSQINPNSKFVEKHTHTGGLGDVGGEISGITETESMSRFKQTLGPKIEPIFCEDKCAHADMALKNSRDKGDVSTSSEIFEENANFLIPSETHIGYALDMETNKLVKMEPGTDILSKLGKGELSFKELDNLLSIIKRYKVTGIL